MSKTTTAIFLTAILLAILGAANGQALPEGRVSLVQDWSHRHVVFSDSGTLQQRVNLMKEPRALHNYLDRVWRPRFQVSTTGTTVDPTVTEFTEPVNQEDATTLQSRRLQMSSNSPSGGSVWRRGPLTGTRPKNTNSKVDWALTLGTGGQFPTGETPAKYQFDVTQAPDCTNDFVVFPILATPSSTQANIIAVNNLYSGTGPTGLCGTTPTVMWSYKLGSAGIALSPALSLDGKKVAFLENANPVIFHVLTWQAGQGTSAIAPYAGTANDVTVSYTTVGGTGCTNTSSGTSNASPYIDYNSDSAFVAADNGILYHIKNVFGGTPTMDYCTLISANSALTSPVYDANVNKVFISNGASVYSVDFNASSGFSNTTSITVAGTGGITLSPIIDASSQMIYVFSASKSGATNSIVSQIPYSLASHVDANIGTAASGYVLDGTFDNNFYTNPDPTTWTLYACGRTTTNTKPALYGLSFASNGIMNVTPAFGPNQNINPGAPNGSCSPLQEFYNGGVDRLFVSTTGSNTVSMFDITTRLTATSTAAATATGYSGGTGSFAVDNISTVPQASSIYFGTMGTSTTTCPVPPNPTTLTVQHAAGSGTTSTRTLTFTIPTTNTGDMIVVAMGGSSSTRTVSSVTDNATGGSDTFTQAAGARHTATGLFSDVWYVLKTTRSGATTVTINYSGNLTNRAAVAWVVSGFTNPVVDVVSGVSNGVPASNTLTGASVTTTSSTEEFVAGFVNTNGAITANPRAGNEFISGGDITANGDAGASLISATAGAHQPVWTGTGTAFASATVAFKEGTTAPTANYCAVKLTQSALQ